MYDEGLTTVLDTACGEEDETQVVDDFYEKLGMVYGSRLTHRLLTTSMRS
jgi:hypothetical protein